MSTPAAPLALDATLRPASDESDESDESDGEPLRPVGRRTARS
jgi:hypothetical protein